MKRREMLKFGVLAAVAPRAALAVGMTCADCGVAIAGCAICLEWETPADGCCPQGQAECGPCCVKEAP